MVSVIDIAAIDDDMMLLQGMAAWISGVEDIRLTETAPSVDEYLASPRVAKVVLLDLNLRDFSDPATNVERLVSAGHKVIVMSVIPAQEARILSLYASGLTLDAVARRVGIRRGTARTYLDRIRNKYAAAGRPIGNRVEYAARVREDLLGRESLGSPIDSGDDSPAADGQNRDRPM